MIFVEIIQSIKIVAQFCHDKKLIRIIHESHHYHQPYKKKCSRRYTSHRKIVLLVN